MKIEKDFAILGLTSTAKPSEIKIAWKRLASQHHPDKEGEASQFHVITEAYKRALKFALKPKVCPLCLGHGSLKKGSGFTFYSYPCNFCFGRGKVIIKE
jgi:DnaJ-class molecular chaperone